MNPHNATYPENCEGEYTYNVDKMQFIVTPIHREDSGRTIHDILLSQMKRDSVNT
jgi:hypothetical protein